MTYKEYNSISNNMPIITYTPATFAYHQKESSLFYTYYQTPAGTLLVLATDRGIFKASFVQDMCDIQGYRKQENFPQVLLLVGTMFQVKVWQAALSIPTGKTISYQELAQAIGHSKAVRAVGSALARNNITYFIPCHRIIGKNGDSKGYAWGVDTKKALLNYEKKFLK